MVRRRLAVTGFLLALLAPACLPQGNSKAQNRSAETSSSTAGEAGIGSLEERQGYRPLVCALHIHSQFSNGKYSIAELAQLAERQHIDVLGIADSFLTRVRYGIGPWKKLFSISRSRPGVLDHGIGAYRSAIQAAQSQSRNVLLLVGMEVTPSYYWQGSIREGLRLYNFDRHLTVLGLEYEEGFRWLPVIENETWANTPKDWRLALGPALTLLVGLNLLGFARRRSPGNGSSLHPARRGIRLAGWTASLAGLCWAYDAYPFGRLTDAYAGRNDVACYQRLVDYVRSQGGLVFWSYPEARYPDITSWGTRMISNSHPEDLVQVQGYNGFEGLYGDTITVTNPGGVWDGLLRNFLWGSQPWWPSIISGVNYHGFKEGGWYDLDRGQTILWAREKTEASVLEAMRTGRGYAVFQGGRGRDLLLRSYAVRSRDGTALAGETLRTASSPTLHVSIDWNAAPPPEGHDTVELELIRNGFLLERQRLKAPLILSRTETLPAGKHYYRLRARIQDYQLLSNPIFVEIP